MNKWRVTRIQTFVTGYIVEAETSANAIGKAQEGLAEEDYDLCDYDTEWEAEEDES